MIVWPKTLPGPQIGTQYNPVDPQLRTQMQSGRSFVRRNFTATPDNFIARWIFTTDAQARRFEEFYKYDTEDGTLWFEMPLLLPQGRGPRTVRFVGIYAGRTRLNPPGHSDGVWEYSANMELYLRPVGPQMIHITEADEIRQTEAGETKTLES